MNVEMSEPIVLVLHLTQGDMARFEAAFETQTRVDRLEVHQKYFLLALLLGLPPPCIHNNVRLVKNGEGLGAFIAWMTSGGHEVDVGREVANCQNSLQLQTNVKTM